MWQVWDILQTPVVVPNPSYNLVSLSRNNKSQTKLYLLDTKPYVWDKYVRCDRYTDLQMERKLKFGLGEKRRGRMVEKSN